jgi:hypothetical protein
LIPMSLHVRHFVRSLPFEAAQIVLRAARQAV